MSLGNEEPRALLERLMADNTAGHELICESSSSQLLVRLSEYSRRHAVLPTLPLAGSVAPRIPTNPPSRALGELFGPIRVNPNSRRRTELTIRSFIHGKPGGLPASYQTAIPVNGSDQEIEAFVRMLIERSRAQRSVHHASVADCRRFDLVIGERGVGKTFFQNYLLSRFSQVFDSERVLYVRVNLLRDFVKDGDDLNIDHWVKSQIAKVVCRYYDANSRAEGPAAKADDLKLDFQRLIRDKLALLPPDEQGKVQESARHMLHNFRLLQNKSEADLDSRSVDRFVAGTIFQAVLDDLRMSIVVVFDGLDLLGYTGLSTARYEAILKGLRAYLTSEVAPYRYHLVFLRPETLHDFEENVSLKHQLSPILDGNPGGECHFGLRPVDPARMWRQRFGALSHHAIVEHYNIDLEQLRAFNEFLLAQRKDPLGPLAVGSYAEAIVKMAGNNSRYCVHLILLAYHSFTLSIKAAADELIKSYQLTEMMMLAGQDYPPSCYRYRLDVLGKVHRSSAPRLFEADFLPSIFRAPIVEAMKVKDLYGNGGLRQVLLPLRILQLLASCLRQRSTTMMAPISAMEIRGLSMEIFQYTELEIQRTLEELSEEELVYPSRRIDIFLPSATDQLLLISPKGQLILDTLLQDPTYLGLACYNLPVPESMVTSVGARRFFRGVTPGPNAQWIVSKIWNSFSLFKIIKCVNEIQEVDVERRRLRMGESTRLFLKGATTEVTPAHGGLFGFVTRIEQRLLELTVKILRSVPPNTDLYRELSAALDDLK